MTRVTAFFIGIFAASISAAATYWLISQSDNDQPLMTETGGAQALQLRDIQERLEQLELQMQQGVASTPTFSAPDASNVAESANAATEPQPGRTSRPGRGVSGPLAAGTNAFYEQRLNRLVSVGFSAAEADEVLRLEEQGRLEVLEWRYDRRKSAMAGNPNITNVMRRDSGIREKLGESDYGRYLEAYGMSASVGVGGVVPGSRGELAGLQDGDEIIRYDGMRVYSPGDLDAVTYKGDKDESVMMTVRRDGADIQLVISRGPVGIRGRARR